MQSKQVQLEDMLPLMQEKLAAGLSVRFSPRGISMLPMLRQGRDSVLLSPLPDRLKKYDLPLYRRDDGKFVLHRIVGVGDGYTCAGDNQFHLERGVQQRHMIALVTAFYRDEREISVDAPGYKLYCRIWHYTRLPRRAWWLLRRIWRRIRHGR